MTPPSESAFRDSRVQLTAERRGRVIGVDALHTTVGADDGITVGIGNDAAAAAIVSWIRRGYEGSGCHREEGRRRKPCSHTKPYGHIFPLTEVR